MLLQDDSPAVPAAVQPVWSVLERERVVRLEGFATLCMPAVLALNYLDLEALAGEPSAGLEPSGRNDERGSAQAHSSQSERWAQTFEDAAPPVSDAAESRSVCGQLLADLRKEFGGEKYLTVARAAAQDALRFGNAVYDTRADEPQILRQQLWTEHDTEGFIALAWCDATFVAMGSLLQAAHACGRDAACDPARSAGVSWSRDRGERSGISRGCHVSAALSRHFGPLLDS